MIDDRGLHAAILVRWNRDTRVTAARLGVTAEGGVASISGHAESSDDRNLAAWALRRVDGAQAVVVAIEVRFSTDHRRSDDEFAETTVGELIWQAVSDGSVEIQAETKCVNPSSQVAEPTGVNRVEAPGLQIRDVSGHTNRATAAPRVSVADVSADIAQALHRSWFFDVNPIQVSAEGGTVRLTGEVRSSADRDIAQSRAQAATGVTRVQNLLQVADDRS